MSVMMLILVIAFGCALCGGAVAGFALGRRRLPDASEPRPELQGEQDRIEHLEEELRRLKEQADFTEKLLSERGSGGSEEGSAKDAGP